MWNLLQADQTARLPMHVALKGPNAGLVGHKKRRPDNILASPAGRHDAGSAESSLCELLVEREGNHTTRLGVCIKMMHCIFVR
jgi:hypothetical protein